LGRAESKVPKGLALSTIFKEKPIIMWGGENYEKRGKPHLGAVWPACGKTSFQGVQTFDGVPSLSQGEGFGFWGIGVNKVWCSRARKEGKT